ncbi:MAG: PadR family transcriptional regulator [Alphaproteobacteria bacterium]
MLEVLVLRLIGDEKVYVADILKRLDQTEFKTAAGTLYPLLGRLRRQGLIEHEWKESPTGPPRKYYTLTRTGAQRLEALTSFWSRVNNALESD